ncbi:MAG: hypothetical protein Q7T45_01135 [Bradyrhizobium sp.]|uniref:hypothetical protein n=1 Tax=Bradyrhizobium sp. TaxID=376 RepID=UPI0027200836|nr:hypothetical protein [Bradyrhizobium sp.]MDO8396404.1 hypothetical protein [Bradyrhizobium sp.]
MELRLSRNEKRLYELIPARGRRITSGELTQQFYNGGAVPLNGRVYIANVIRSLKRKSRIGIPGVRRVESTVGSGRKAIEVWLASANE